MQGSSRIGGGGGGGGGGGTKGQKNFITFLAESWHSKQNGTIFGKVGVFFTDPLSPLLENSNFFVTLSLSKFRLSQGKVCPRKGFMGPTTPIFPSK